MNLDSLAVITYQILWCHWGKS